MEMSLTRLGVDENLYAPFLFSFIAAGHFGYKEQQKILDLIALIHRQVWVIAILYALCFHCREYRADL